MKKILTVITSLTFLSGVVLAQNGDYRAIKKA